MVFDYHDVKEDCRSFGNAFIFETSFKNWEASCSVMTIDKFID